MFLRGNYLIVVLTLCQSSSNVIPKLPALDGGGSLNNPQSVANTGTQSQPHPPPPKIIDKEVCRGRLFLIGCYCERTLDVHKGTGTTSWQKHRLRNVHAALIWSAGFVIVRFCICMPSFNEIYLKQRYFWLICNVCIVPGSAGWGSCWSMTVHCLCSTDPHHRPPDGSKCGTKTCQTVKIICLLNHV